MVLSSKLEQVTKEPQKQEAPQSCSEGHIQLYTAEAGQVCSSNKDGSAVTSKNTFTLGKEQERTPSKQTHLLLYVL